jgi:hypothetical protein
VTRVQVRLDHSGIRQVLRSAPMRAMVDAAGEQAAQAIRAQGRIAQSGAQASGVDLSGDVSVRPGVGAYDQRPVAIVTVAHPAAVAMQARHGLVTRAVRAMGAGVSWNARQEGD